VVAAWPEPVERVSSFLRKAGAEARIEEFADGTPTAADAAAAAGCEVAQIVKSLVLVCGERPVLALVPGDRRCDPDKVARAVSESGARIASPAEVERVTGYEPGAVAPFGHAGIGTVLLDPMLLRHEIVWAGAGSSHHIVGLAPAELARLTRARTVDVIRDDPYDFASELTTRLAGEPGDRGESKER
jgi:prolyl-tRNA editing enzyme YbaK/EbsC (Cys-tRNA(Pro) deacylase)